MIHCKTDAEMKSLNTFGVEAKARAYITFSERTEAEQLDAEGVFAGPFRLLGGGANSLFVCREYEGKIIQFCGKKVQWIEPQRLVEAEAGIVWDDLVQQLLEAGAVGIENLSGIPGHLGGCLSGNIGAYGAEISDFVDNVSVYDTVEHRYYEISKQQANFAYRNSIFKSDDAGRYVILSVRFRLPDPHDYKPNLRYKAIAEKLNGAEVTPAAIRKAVLEMRNQKLPDPAKTGNAGSFFKNPIVTAEKATEVLNILGDGPSFPEVDGRVKLSAGWILDRCGWKGFTTPEGAGTDVRNALVLVNRGNASGADIYRLAQKIISDIKEKTGIELQPEVKFIK